jgi:DNA invertase Pin-like site-specific DNA recombinase
METNKPIVKVLGIIRKSPTKQVEESIEVQKKSCIEKAERDYPNQEVKFDWCIDICKGDDPNRKNLQKYFKALNDYASVYCYNPDRFSRSWLGLKWFHEYFSDGLQLRFCSGVGDLYTKEGNVNPDIYLQFFILCGFAQYELMRIRARIKLGIARVQSDPKLRALKYQGGKKGRSWK